MNSYLNGHTFVSVDRRAARQRKWRAILTAVILALALGLQPTGSLAHAEEPAADLANAERRALEAEGAMPAIEDQLTTASERYRLASERAAPALRRVARDKAQLRRLERRLAIRQRKTEADISHVEERHRQEVEDHDEEVRNGVGFGLAAMLAGLIAVAWGWFRATAPVAALTRMDRGRAIGLCVGGGLLGLIVGAALGRSDGAAGAFGAFLFCLGLILPTTLLLGRHSAEVQRGRANPLFRRARLPAWVPLGFAGLMFMLFLAGTGSAVVAPDASSDPISSRLEEQAEGAAGGYGASMVTAAREEVQTAVRLAAAPLAQRTQAQRELGSARDALHGAQRRLAAARSAERAFGRRLASLEAKEEREREKAEARERREQEAQEEAEVEEAASECDPNYSGCLDPYSSDYDCAGGSGDGPDYTGTVEVLGSDHYGLDDDGDGIGCDLG